MALTLEIEFLSGVCYAALGADSAEPDWPPQPDRVYSALVATWAAHGRPDDERRALEWLERLPVPACLHSGCDSRDAPTAFVPPNDPSVGRAKLAARVIPAARNRQPRRFPVARPQEPVVRHHWPVEPDEATLHALDRLARDTSYVGHSASLTRCRFIRCDLALGEAWRPPKRRVYPGRLQELCVAYARFERSADRKDRPAPGAFVPPLPAPSIARANIFSARWLVLEHAAGDMPDLRAAALVARDIRRALMSGYGKAGLTIPAEVSGHQGDGSPARIPHMAVVPLSFTGFAHGDGRVLGFALVPSDSSGLLDDDEFLRVLRRIAPLDGAHVRRCFDVKSPEGASPQQAYSLRLSLSFEAPAGKRSIDPALYTRSARDFATVTPIVLDRHPKARGAERQDEMAELVCAACVRIGLPAPMAVRVDRHATQEGAPSAYPPGDSPDWMRWRVPESLAGRPLTHALIHFKHSVDGPVLLGAGRFVGMGLCRPLD